MAAPATRRLLGPETLKVGIWVDAARQPGIQHFPLAGMALLFPLPTNATNQPLERTTHKL